MVDQVVAKRTQSLPEGTQINKNGVYAEVAIRRDKGRIWGLGSIETVGGSSFVGSNESVSSAPTTQVMSSDVVGMMLDELQSQNARLRVELAQMKEAMKAERETRKARVMDEMSELINIEIKKHEAKQQLMWDMFNKKIDEATSASRKRKGKNT